MLNSPKVWAKDKTLAVKNPLCAKGSTSVKKRSKGEARKVAATSKTRPPAEAKAFCRGCTTKGKENNIEPMTKPLKVKAKCPMPSVSKKWPTAPWGPKSTSK